MPAEVDDGPDDGDVLAALAQRRDEAAVDLDLLHREALEVGQRRVPGAEVVDREADAEVAQPVQQRDGAGGVGHDRALRDLQGEPVRRDAVPPQETVDLLDEVGVVQAARGQVDRHADVVTRRAPLGAGGQRGVEHERGQRADEAAALGDGDELVGRDVTQLGVAPAGQRLDPRDLAVGQPALRLDVDLDPWPFCSAERSSETSVRRRGLFVSSSGS